MMRHHSHPMKIDFGTKNGIHREIPTRVLFDNSPAFLSDPRASLVIITLIFFQGGSRPADSPVAKTLSRPTVLATARPGTRKGWIR